MQLPIRTLMLAHKCRQLNAFVRKAGDARSVQHAALLEKLRKNQGSAFGREWGFAELRTVDDFRKRLPISDYEPFRPYIQRVMQGEVEAMFAPKTRVLMFATTSGTTSMPKLLPVTDDFYRAYKQSWQLWGTGAFRDYPELLNLKSLQLTSDWQVTAAPSGVPVGNISGLAAATRPFFARPMFILPLSIIRIRDHEAKHYTSLRIALASRKIGMLITANPSTLVEFAKRCDAEREALIRDIYDGTLTPRHDIPAEIRRALKGRCKANPRRARELEAIVQRTGHLYPRDAWPRIQLLAVWTGGSVGVYLSQLPQYYGDVPIRDHGISASEGRMSIPLSCATQSGMLDYRNHFYEFIPEEEYGSAHPTVLEAHELTPGKHYFILLTTSAGIYRYDICDVVRCDGYEGQAPLLSFMNKGKHFSSVTGEKLSEYQVVQAVRESFTALRLPSCTFTLAPTMGERPQYRLVLEPGAQADAATILENEVQRRLEQINVEYGDKCRSGRIDPLRIRVIPAGTWARLRSQRSRERGNFEEFKHPCLTSDLAFVDKLPTGEVDAARAAS